MALVSEIAQKSFGMGFTDRYLSDEEVRTVTDSFFQEVR